MTATTPDDVRTFLLDELEGALAEAGVDRDDVADDTDLLESGIIDSMRIVQLIALVESEFPVEADWDDYDPEDILVVGPFCSYVAAHASASDGGRP